MPPEVDVIVLSPTRILSALAARACMTAHAAGVESDVIGLGVFATPGTLNVLASIMLLKSAMTDYLGASLGCSGAAACIGNGDCFRYPTAVSVPATSATCSICSQLTCLLEITWLRPSIKEADAPPMNADTKPCTQTFQLVRCLMTFGKTFLYCRAAAGCHGPASSL